MGMALRDQRRTRAGRGGLEIASRGAAAGRSRPHAAEAEVTVERLVYELGVQAGDEKILVGFLKDCTVLFRLFF